jgi:hypothetical protein
VELGKLKPSLGSRTIQTIRTPEFIPSLRKEEDADNLETARRVWRDVMADGIDCGLNKWSI